MNKTIDKIIIIYQDFILYFGFLCRECCCCSPNVDEILSNNNLKKVK